MAVVLARAASLAEAGNDGAQGLADVHCADARRRIADLWAAARAAQTGDEPDYPAVAALPVAVGRPEEIVQDMVLPSRRGTRKQDRADAFRHQAPASRAGRGNTAV
ncbi:hypothetical protein [Streptomyces sp. NPDC001388]|uniref:hypothetical protein n=1 Tax=Streptomyces sp. NPDC001388 TaxID=3364568 RepID=UPI003691E5CC